MQPAEQPANLYRQLQNASALDKVIHLENAVLKRDRVVMTFREGLVYFSTPVAGKIRSGVFIGSGTVEAEPPDLNFEKENVRRLLKADKVSSDFKSAVLRFTDDTAEELRKDGSLQSAAGSEPATHLASELEPRLLKETGMNVSSRQLESILNAEAPGFFLAQFDGGARRRFTYVLDPQAYIPSKNFTLNAGEKGLIFAFDETLLSNDVWMAFHAEEEYRTGFATYSDVANLVDTDQYNLTLDLLEPKKVLGLNARLDLVSRRDGVLVIPFAIGEGLSIAEDERRKKQLHLIHASVDGAEIPFFQESWETGFTVVLPKPMAKGEHLSLALELNGDFMFESTRVSGTYFPRSTESWYPRHGYLGRSRFDISMIHRKSDSAVSVGVLVKEGPAPGTKDAVLTEFRMDEPIGLASFAVGKYEIHKESAKQQDGKVLTLEFYSMPGSRAAIKEDFLLAEMDNSVRYFSNLFGEYPYPLFRGVFHPFGFGQGFPSMIMIPNTDAANFRSYSFIAHETSHQWWGDMVLWRSYRDQWLSEGFAEYSGMLYAQLRDKTSSEKQLIEQARRILKEPPETLTGIGHARLVDVGPLIMGHRVESRETRGAYGALTYQKGALVLRMLHFLFTDPQTGDGTPFFTAMRDFVTRYKGKTASTDQFFGVLNEHLQDTPIAKKYGYKDLNWFYRQWVTESTLPSYELSYHLEPAAGGGVILEGQLTQTGVSEGESWFQVLPLVLHFGGDKISRGTVAVLGEKSPVRIKLPTAPEKVELDPEMWILSDKSTTRKQ